MPRLCLYALLLLSGLSFAQELDIEKEEAILVRPQVPSPLVETQQLEDPYLPLEPWSKEDEQALADGRLEVGYYLLVLPRVASRDYFPELPDAPQELIESGISGDGDDSIDRSWVSPEMLTRYFSKRPKSELSDPQELLSNRAYKERQAFLAYHKVDSKVPIYVYLFARNQQVPLSYEIDRQLTRQFGDDEPVCLVYYYLDAPEKSELALTPNLQDQLSVLEFQRLLDSAIAEAQDRSDGVDQLERFTVQLSIRLYWLEKALADQLSPEVPVSVAPEILLPEERVSTWQKVEPLLGYLTLISFGLLVAVTTWLARRILLARRRYIFPEVKKTGRLQAPRGAGVGVVMRFRSAKVPPSEQREHVRRSF